LEHSNIGETKAKKGKGSKGKQGTNKKKLAQVV